jgi:hypothetical protein
MLANVAVLCNAAGLHAACPPALLVTDLSPNI